MTRAILSRLINTARCACAAWCFAMAATSCVTPEWNHVDLDPAYVDTSAQAKIVRDAARRELAKAIERCAGEVLSASPVTDPAMAYVMCVDEMNTSTTRDP